MNYVPIRVSTLRGDQKTNFNIYVQVAGKHILYIRTGDSFEGTRLNRLKEKKLKKMWITAEEEDGYRKYLSRNIEMAFDESTPKSMGERVEIIQGVQQNHAEEVMENPENETSYNMAKEGSERYVKFLLKENKALEAMLNIENTESSLGHHGVTVATLSTALAQRLGFDEKQKQLLALGCLLHDIGHMESGLNFARPLGELSKEEMTLYKMHPEKGATKVKDLRHFDKDVIRIIYEHEECADGSGFPQGLTEDKANALSIVAGTANAFDRLMTFEKIPRNDAAKKLMIERVGKHPLQQIQILQQIIKDLKI